MATTNAGKQREFDAWLGHLGFVLTPAPQGFEVDETGTTFAQNAVLKACALRAQCNIACIADDSGLCVDALGGAPGLYSARYSGEPDPALRDAANCDTLLAALKGQAGPMQRQAQFVCAIAYVPQQGPGLTFEGRLSGHIAAAPQGALGFGYDPIFVPDTQTQTMAEMGAETRYRLSHRAQALRLLCDYLTQGF